MATPLSPHRVEYLLKFKLQAREGVGNNIHGENIPL